MMPNTVNVLTAIFEAFVIIMFINAYSEKRSNLKTYFYLIPILCLAAAINIINAFANFTILNVVLITFSIFIIALIFNKNVKRDIIISFILTLIFSITEVFTLFVITGVSNISVKEATDIYEYRVLGIILSKLLAFVILKIITLKYKPKDDYSISLAYWFLFCSMFITTLISIYLLFIFQYNSKISVYKDLSVWCSFGLLFSTFFSLYLYEKIMRQAKVEREQELFKQQIKAQSKHLNEILIAQKQLKKVYHDFKNHCISIQSFFENNDCIGGIEYINDLNKLIKFSDNNIETGNTSLDAIINTKRNIALSKGINFLTNIQVPENLFIDPIDICIILGNSLDNCIEACERIKNGNKQIEISIIYDDNSVICKIMNTVEKRKIDIFKTLKKDKLYHGFGIENINSALSKYKNISRYLQTEDKFIFSFVIFNN